MGEAAMHRKSFVIRAVFASVVGCIGALCSGVAAAGSISLVGQLDPSDPQDVFLYEFTLSAPTTVAIQTWGYGGTLSAPGGTNAKGNAIAAGGFDPYVTVFNGSGPTATFRVSNDDGACPPGALSAGLCLDSTLSLSALPAGTYTLALSAFENMSFAENYGSGTLADGFIGLGSFGGRTSAFAVDISGAGIVVPALALGYVPNALTFGAQTLNVASGPMTILVTNTGSAPVALGALSLGGANAADFTVGGNCAGTLFAAASCVISVTFKPTATGLREATLALNSNTSGSPALINLHGTGTNSVVSSASLSTTDLNFGNQAVNVSSALRSLIITNSGDAPLIIGVDIKGGNNPGEFAVTDNCAGQTIAAQATCTMTIVFTPASLGLRSATLTINSNASNNPVTVRLGGVGLDPTATPVPTLGNWALLALSLLLASTAMLSRRRMAQRLRTRDSFTTQELNGLTDGSSHALEEANETRQ